MANSADFWKIAKMALFNPYIWFFWVPNASILSAMKVSFSDFIQNMSQVLYKCIKVGNAWIPELEADSFFAK